MTSSISSTANKNDDGSYGWEKSVTDVNNVDENFANARDLGYTRMNYARVTAVAELGKYNEKDTYKIQVQSNGKLSISLRDSGAEESVLDLGEYEDYLDQLKQQTDLEGYAAEQEKKQAELEENGVLSTTAPNLTLKVYQVKNGKQVLIADSTADKDSKEYENLKALLTGEYKATAGDYYFEVGKSEEASDSEDYPYAMQILQGTDYKHDYVMTQADSEDTTNETITNTPSSGSGSTSMISAAYAAQIQAVQNQGAADLLSAGASNLSSLTSDDDGNSLANSLFSSLISSSNG